MTVISQEEENYIRMCLLLSRITPRAVRAFFDIEFHPSCLYASISKAFNILNDLKLKRIINQSQWNLLFPRSGCPDSKCFDITLMITLLTNLTKLSHYDSIPLENDTSTSADLARIKYYRSYISHHISHKDGKIDSVFFNKAWDDISWAVRRLSDQDMQDECIKLKTKYLDRSTVPWNIRVQINQVLEEWKVNAGNFVETKGAKHEFDCVQGNNCVTITASSGVGKTATLRHVALKMAAAGYDIQLVTSPHDIVKFYNPDQKTLFVIDDFCGIYSINQSDLSSWETVIERIEVLIHNKVTKIIVACRLQVYQDEQFETLFIFNICVCNLQSENLCLSKTEKQSIAEVYMEADASKLKLCSSVIYMNVFRFSVNCIMIILN